MVADHIQVTWTDASDPDGAAARVFVQHLRTAIMAAGIRPVASSGALAGGGRPAGADAGLPVGRGSSAVVGEQAAPDLVEALEVAAQVESDGRQRAYPYRWPSRDAAETFRQQLTVRLSEEARAGRPRIAHARPWVWASSSTGSALSPAGEETGVELRFSYYQ